MNNKRSSENDHLKSLRILDELSGNDTLTQRDLSQRLGIALGLVNSYIRNLARKGYITVKAIPSRRYAYYLTPKGFAEKTRLTYNLLSDYTRVYREARENIKSLFSRLKSEGTRQVVFAGADEVAEIAYITLQEMDMELGAVLDDELIGKQFFGREIQPIESAGTLKHDCIVVTSYLKQDRIYQKLLRSGIREKTIRKIFAR